MINKIQYQHLAELFRYPKEGYSKKVNDCYDFLDVNYPEAAKLLDPFINYVNTHTNYEVEELFGKTFHIQAVCYLDLGYVLFAEDYKRGEFLVQMKKEQERIGNDCGEELVDNLPNVLTFLAKSDDIEFTEEFAVRILKPALKKMRQEFEESRMELKDKVRRKKQKVVIMEDVGNKNIYQHAIESLQFVLNKDYAHVLYEDPEIVPTLGGSVGTVLSGSCGPSCSTPVSANVTTNN